jgi:acyl homoserine lactone synthase
MINLAALPGYSIKIGARREFDSRELQAMYLFRASVFRERLAWHVGLLGGMEVDAYDALDPVYLMMLDRAGTVCACLRMLPTTAPYMLRNTFAGLLQDNAPPASEKIVELSRFAVAASVQRGYGFSVLTSRVILAAIDYGFRQGIEKYVTVTTPALERLLTRFGLQMRRLCGPAQIDVDDALALVIDIPSSYRTLKPGTRVDGTAGVPSTD